MYRKLLPFLLLFISFFIEAKPPSLTPRDTKIKIEEILKSHVSHQRLTTELIARAFENYLDELDPTKTYLLQTEISEWSEPSEALLVRTLSEIKRENFQAFEEIHQRMLEAIERKQLIEDQIDINNLPQNVQVSEFKDMSWAENEEELIDRNRKIRSLQLEAAEKLNEESKEQFLQRLQKRRLRREIDIQGKNPTEFKQIVLSTTLKSLSSSLDSQTSYFTPTEANHFMTQIQQKVTGIGAQLRDDLNGLTVVRLIEGGPAISSNKIKVADRIIAVNKESIVGMDINEAVELIRGKKGTRVTLTLLREIHTDDGKRDEKHEVELSRGEIVIKENRFDISQEPFGDGVIAVLKLFSFYQDNSSSSADDLRKAIQELQKKERVKGIILDLRNNSGGLLTQAVAVTGLFIKKGIVVSIKDNTGQVQHLRNFDDRVTWDGHLVILINRISASASEIVAQTLQDYGRTIVIGDEKSFGKGTFQTFTLETSRNGKVNPKGEYKVTQGRYYTVSGKSPQLEGVKSDIVIPGLFSKLDIGEEFSKFPLDSDEIAANFNDDLSDVPAMHRSQMLNLYRYNQQLVQHNYDNYLDILRSNSQERIDNNQNYQNFLRELENKDFSSEAIDFFGQADLQLIEATNVMKDLLFLFHEEKEVINR